MERKLVPKLERKYVERYRRKHMKNLCNQLHSMLPNHASTSKETMTVPDQVDAAVNYIESLKMNLEKSKKHLEELKMATNEPSPSTKSIPQIEFHEMGQHIVVVLITGLNNIATFNNIIRLCHEEGVQVVATDFQLNGNSTLQISHESKGQNSTMEFRATSLCDKMKELIYGPIPCNTDTTSNLPLWDWDYIFESELLGYDALELIQTPVTKSKSKHA